MSSHETFLHAIKQLELRHSGRLKETEGQREIIRKVGVVRGGGASGWWVWLGAGAHQYEETIRKVGVNGVGIPDVVGGIRE